MRPIQTKAWLARAKSREMSEIRSFLTATSASSMSKTTVWSKDTLCSTNTHSLSMKMMWLTDDPQRAPAWSSHLPRFPRSRNVSSAPNRCWRAKMLQIWRPIKLFTWWKFLLSKANRKSKRKSQISSKLNNPLFSRSLTSARRLKTRMETTWESCSLTWTTRSSKSGSSRVKPLFRASSSNATMIVPRSRVRQAIKSE